MPISSLKTSCSHRLWTALARYFITTIFLTAGSAANAATNYTWTGAANGLWSNANNWSPSGVPASGDFLSFPVGAANLTNTNDLNGLSLVGISLSGVCAINGNGIALTGSYRSVPLSTVNLGIDIQANGLTIRGSHIGGAVNINASGTVLLRTQINGPLNVNGNAVTIDNMWISGGLSGSGNITIAEQVLNRGGSFAVLRGSGNYSGTISGAELDLDGAFLPLATISTAVIIGNGTVGAVTGTVIPGRISPIVILGDPTLQGGFVQDRLGTLNTGNLNLTGGGFDVAGPNPGVDYSRINVTGTVTIGALASLALNFDPNFKPTVGQQFTLINNDGNDPIVGTFKDYPEGITFIKNYYKYSLSYRGGDGNDLVLTVLPYTPSTIVTLTASPNPAVFGAPLTLTATVVGSGGSVPTGTITFSSYSPEAPRTTISSVPLVSGIATFIIPILRPDLLSHDYNTVFAGYSGDTNYAADSGATLIQVSYAETLSTTTITSSINPALPGQPVTFTATVTGLGPTPTGSVLFKDGNAILGSVALSDGTASLTTSSLTAGTHTITASYPDLYVYFYDQSAASLAGGQVVAASPGLGFSSQTIFGGKLGSPYAPVSITAIGGTPAYSYSISGGALPQGLNLSSTGVLSGTPTQDGTFSFTVAATDSLGLKGTHAYKIIIASNLLRAQDLYWSQAIYTQSIGGTVTMRVGASSGLPVSYSSLTPAVCTVAGSVVSAISGGTCTLAADQSGNANYAAAARIIYTFSVVATGTQPQTINFPTPATQAEGINLNLTASATSGLTVAFSSLTTTVCTVVDNQASFIAFGNCTIASDQGGNATYAPAPRVTQTFAVSGLTRQAQTITFTNPGGQPVGQTIALSVIATSGLTVTFSSLTPAICVVSANQATFVAAGACSIAADQAGNSDYAAAPRVTQSFAVFTPILQAQSIIFANPGAQTVGQAVVLNVSATSGLNVILSSLTTAVCTVSGNQANLVAAGNCTIAADQSGNFQFSAAPRVTQSFIVMGPSLQAQSISFANPGSQTVGRTLTLIANATSGLSVAYSSLTTNVCTVSGNTVSFISAGSCTIAADQNGNTIYSAAPRVMQAFAVNSTTAKQSQTILFADPGSQNLVSTTVSINLLVYATSGLPVIVISQSPAVCTVSGTTVNALATGFCQLTADQAGNDAYFAANRAYQTFVVTSNPLLPGPPTNLNCIPGVKQAICSFRPPANSGGSAVTSYSITCTALDGAGSVGSGFSLLSATIHFLSSGHLFTCVASAFNSSGTGPASALSNIFMPLATGPVPPAPSITRVLAGNGQATVFFTGQASDTGGPNLTYAATITPNGFTSTCIAPCNSITIPVLTNGNSYTFTVTAANGVGTSAPSAPSNAVTPLASNPVSAPTPPLAQRGGSIDVDGNGNGQLVLRSASGQYQVGRLVGTQFQFSNSAFFSPNYRVIAFGDFNGNGKSDIAQQNMTQGEFGDVIISYDFNLSMTLNVRAVKLVWLVEAIADMDGDGNTDMVFRFTGNSGAPNDTGVSYIWFMNGNTVTQVRKRGGAPLGWTLLGATDINGDLAADMIYVSPTNDVRALMATPLRTCANLSAGSLPIGATALKLADFNGIGRAAILSRHPNTGATQLLTLDANALTLPAPTVNPDDPNASCTPSNLQVATTTISLPTVDPTWQFYASGDFNGDGYVDIVWLQPNGILTLWLMGPNIAAPTIINNVGTAPSGFSVLQP